MQILPASDGQMAYHILLTSAGVLGMLLPGMLLSRRRAAAKDGGVATGAGGGTSGCLVKPAGWGVAVADVTEVAAEDMLKELQGRGEGGLGGVGQGFKFMFGVQGENLEGS